MLSISFKQAFTRCYALGCAPTFTQGYTQFVVKYAFLNRIDPTVVRESISTGQRGGESHDFKYYATRLCSTGAPAKALRCTAKATSTQGGFCISGACLTNVPEVARRYPQVRALRHQQRYYFGDI